MLSRPCQKECSHEPSDRKKSSLRNYTSLLSLNKRQRNHCAQQESFSTSSSNCLVSKSISLLLLHFLSVYITIYLYHYFNIPEFYNSLRMISFLYSIFCFLIILFPSLRFRRPFNIVFFIFYTLLACMLFASLAIHSPQFDFIRFAVFLISISQIFLILFCFQTNFTLTSSPLLPYLYIFSILVGILATYFLTIYFCMKHKIAFTSDKQSIDFEKTTLSILTAFMFIFYQIFDLQYVITDSASSSDFITVAFNLISVDYFKIFLMLLSFLLELIK